MSDRIAVIGMACRVPGASNPHELWENVLAGVESISVLPPDAQRDAGRDAGRDARRDVAYVPAGGFIEHVGEFDAALFGYSPREAALMDPQHRLMHECAWEALEDAGYGAREPQARVGVFAGVANSTYLHTNVAPTLDATDFAGRYQALTTGERDFIATRLSYQLDLSGPSMNVQTACSTSLVAIHMACQSLLNGECDMALAGAAAIALPQKAGYVYEEGLIVSPDGHCRAFAADAQGTVPGNGAGMVLLKRLDDALADGDAIHAVILGSAVNNDGARKVGFTAPGVSGQANVIVEAQAIAEVAPSTIGYVEAHGTGTAVGDPIEVAALKSAFGSTPAGSCALGSIKSNIGHLDTAAGVIGFIKAVLVVEHGRIPPALHAAVPNPALELERSPFYLPATAREWQAEVRRAGVSAFGIGGTNAHVVIEQPPRRAPSPVTGPVTLTLSAQTATALATLSARLADFLETNDVSLADVAFTLAHGRKSLPVRRVVVCATREQAVHALRRAESTDAEPVECEGRRIALPTYPFERKRHWIEPGPVAQAPRSGIDDWLYTPAWQRSAPIAAPADEELQRGKWLLCGAESALRDAVRARLQQSGATLTPSIDEATAVLHFGSDARSVIQAAQARPASLTLVTRASSFVLGDEVVDPANAAAMAIVRVLSQEHPETRGRVVDLPRGLDDARTVERILAEASGADQHAVVAYRGRHRWIPSFTQLQLAPASVFWSASVPRSSSVPRSASDPRSSSDQPRNPEEPRGTRGTRGSAGDTCLITGGTGRVGRALAKHLCRRGVNVVLVSRTTVAEPWTLLADGEQDSVSIDLDEILTADERLLVLQGDVADPVQMRAAFDAAMERFGTITTVIHAAGVSADRTFQTIEELDDEGRTRHLGAKTKGVDVLRALVPEFHVRTCVLMSSLSAVLGGLGFAAYAGANASMDLVAQQEDGRHGVRWVSIGWDAWRFDDEAHGIATRLVDSAIRPEEGIAVLEQILASDIRGHVLVSTTDLAARAMQSVTRDASAMPQLATPGNDVATVVVNTWRDLLGVDAIQPDDDFYDLGGNSLLATQAVSRLRRAFDIDLSVRVLFDETTAAGLARHIEKRLPAGARAR